MRLMIVWFHNMLVVTLADVGRVIVGGCVTLVIPQAIISIILPATEVTIKERSVLSVQKNASGASLITGKTFFGI